MSGGFNRIRRFVSLASAAVLAGALIAPGSTAHANSTSNAETPATGYIYNLVPITPLNGGFVPGGTVQFYLTVTTPDPRINGLSANSAIAFDDSVGDLSHTFETIDQTPDSAIFSGVGGTTNFWNLPGPDTPGTATYSAGTAPLGLPGTVDYFQATPAHSPVKSGTTTLEIPAGTYTAVTFSVPILATTIADHLTVILPSAYAGYTDTLTNDDYVAGRISGTSGEQGVPSFGTSALIFTGVVPEPSSLLIGALGMLPILGGLRRRHTFQEKRKR